MVPMRPMRTCLKLPKLHVGARRAIRTAASEECGTVFWSQVSGRHSACTEAAAKLPGLQRHVGRPKQGAVCCSAALVGSMADGGMQGLQAGPLVPADRGMSKACDHDIW